MKVGKETLRLAVGSKIYNEQNLIIMPDTAPSRPPSSTKSTSTARSRRSGSLTPEEAKAASARK